MIYSNIKILIFFFFDRIQSQLLKRNEDTILKGLDHYKTPSKESKDKIQTGKVEWRGRTYELDAQQKTFVDQISARLVRNIVK